jgi:hypothetical protein
MVTTGVGWPRPLSARICRIQAKVKLAFER